MRCAFGVVGNQIVVSEKRGIAKNGEYGRRRRGVEQIGSGWGLFWKERNEESQNQADSQDRARGNSLLMRALKALGRKVCA